MQQTSLTLKPNANQPIRLLCLGDSITDGFWLEGGYRNTLCSLISAHRQEALVRFVGPNYGGSGYSPRHAGYSCHSTVDIPASVSGPRIGITRFLGELMAEYPADVVFLLIGTNDILSLFELDRFGERVRKIAERILDSLPRNGRLYLSTLPYMDAVNSPYISPDFFTSESIDAAVNQCNQQIRETVLHLKAAGRPIFLADVNRVLTKADLYDGVHPSEKGYEKLGQFWYGKLLSCLTDNVPQSIAVHDFSLRRAL